MVGFECSGASSAAAFKDLVAKQKLDMCLPWVAKYEADPGAIKSILENQKLSSSLQSYHAGFPGSAAATRGILGGMIFYLELVSNLSSGD